MLNEAQLLKKAQQNDKTAFELLLQSYEKRLNSICRGYFLLDAEEDDLLQEARSAFWKAVKEFDPHQTASFSTFSTTVIKNHILNVIKKHNRKNNELLHHYVSLNNQGAIELADGQQEGYVVASVETSTPESETLQQNQLNELQQQIKQALSEYELQILEIYLTGVSIADISKTLNKPEKSIYNALQRIRSKLEFLNKTN